jgi:hypothetical protein
MAAVSEVAILLFSPNRYLFFFRYSFCSWYDGWTWKRDGSRCAPLHGMLELSKAMKILVTSAWFSLSWTDLARLSLA